MRVEERTRVVELAGVRVEIVERVVVAGDAGWAWGSVAPVAVRVHGVETRLDH